jgi:hypothetical protein
MRIGFSFLALTLLAPSVSLAGVPRQIRFQGRLTDSTGTPVSNTTLPVSFRIFAVASGGTPCYSEDQQEVSLANGIFHWSIGAASPTGIDLACTFAAEHFLELQVGGDSPMNPRIPLSAVPYALNADRWEGHAFDEAAPFQMGTPIYVCPGGELTTDSARCTTEIRGGPGCPTFLSSGGMSCWEGYGSTAEQLPSSTCWDLGCFPVPSSFPQCEFTFGTCPLNLPNAQNVVTCHCTPSFYGYLR